MYVVIPPLLEATVFQILPIFIPAPPPRPEYETLRGGKLYGGSATSDDMTTVGQVICKELGYEYRLVYNYE